MMGIEAGPEDLTIQSLKAAALAELKRQKFVPEDISEGEIELEPSTVAQFIGINSTLINSWMQRDLFSTLPFSASSRRYFRLIDILRAIFIKDRYCAIANGRTAISTYDYLTIRKSISAGWNGPRGLAIIDSQLKQIVAGWNDIVQQAASEIPEGYVRLPDGRLIKKPRTDFEF